MYEKCDEKLLHPLMGRLTTRIISTLNMFVAFKEFSEFATDHHNDILQPYG
jgi:hypothetical protein